MITVTLAGRTIEVAAGTALQHICDAHDTPVTFGCRAARCGACMIKVISSADNLTPAGPGERAVLDVLALSPDWRLACQATVLDTVTIDVAD
ncbi:2Fe-2S iron-sulfur cluster-binding protein [Streptomyces sp. VNUA116]|uniref:2Fe-2S iron-sulfur cluster-binding protein n=1 Tax=Streptomyces sp. VNUA116 TaxID=3062449 RepID=UPI002676DA6A|nr:2Fe-2S iron-sulfur cluster-binding protein [Streptomyces sp. VNUA116]WKU42737.1 2Fe-2S iron-sulfur cluster-binding protein [Streptomyces sp. VNUA116]